MNILKFILFLLLSINSLFAEVSTKELLAKLENPKIAILDTRSEDSYNGWILNGESRGGHIKGAQPFPASWINSLKTDDEVLQGLRSKTEIILYGSSQDDISKVSDFLAAQEFKNIDIFSTLNDKQLPLIKYKNFEKLVPASYINSLLEDKKEFKLFEVSWGDGKDYKKAHIPTAVHVNTDLVEEGPIWNYRSNKELEKFVLDYGIDKKTTVVLYGPDSMPASRVAVILMAMGVDDVRILNGGFKAWSDAGYASEKGDNKPQAITSFGGEFFTNSKLIISTKDAESLLKNPNAQLVSIRAHDEFIGKTSGYSYIKPKGRIKGAVWGKAGSDAYHLEDYRSASGKMKDKMALETMWKELGVDTSKHLSFYCGTGWRGAEVLFDAYVMGYDNVSLYDGGWLEWSLNGKRDVVIEYKK